jgi:hypothetical protein
MRASLRFCLAYASGYCAGGLRPSEHLLVTRTVREGASVHRTKSQSTLCVIADYLCTNGVVDGDLCNARFTPLLPRLRVGLLRRWPAAIWHLLVTRTVREGASVHRTKSQSTLCVIADYLCANGVVDGDSCNAGFIPLPPRLRVGLLRRWPPAIWHLLVTRTVREGAPLHGTGSQSTLCVIADYLCTKGIVDGD